MKIFTKIGIALLVMFLSSGIVMAQMSANEFAPKKVPVAVPPSDALFDLQFDWPVGVGGGEAGIETDGSFIYTSKWNGAGEFYQYGMDGTYLGVFTVPGSTGCRDIAFDGTYFYGAAAATTIFQMDIAASTMISTFTAPTAVRAIAYNEDDDAFYGNNWSTAIVKFDMAGANLGSFPVGPVGASYYGLAYDNYSPGAPYLWGYAQTGASLNELVQMALPAGTETGVFFDLGTVITVGTGLAGGLCIDNNLVTGYWTIMGTSQNVDIWGLELCPDGATPLVNDLGVQVISEPVSGLNLTNAEPVTISIKNYGSDPQTSFDVSFTLDGGTPVVESVSTTLNAGDTYVHTFGPTVDLSAYGTYNFEACVTLAGDENAANDCKTKAVENIEPSLCLDGLYTSGCTFGDGLIYWDLADVNGVVIGCDGVPYAWYHDFTDQVHTFEPGMTYDLTVEPGYTGTFMDVWVDWNGDLFMADDELLVNDYEMATTGIQYVIPVTIPADAPSGDFILRYRTNWLSGIVGSCDVYSYGNMCDFGATVGGTLVYCDASGGGDEFIDGVEFGDINTVGSGENGYEDFTALSTDVAQGGTYTLTVYNGNSYSSDDWGVWVDVNNDGTFSDEEMIICDISNGGDVIDYTIDVPGDTPLGPKRMRIRLKYSGDVCPFDPCGTTTYGEVEDYTVNVIMGSPTVTIFADDFEAYNAGEQLACQNPTDWTTWSNLPCDATEDAYVSDAYAYSGSNSVNIVTNNDLVKNFDTYFTSGVYNVSLMAYVPTGADGYYNVMSDFDGAYEWGFEVYFNVGGDGSVSAGGTGAATFTYPFDTWMMSELMVDLDNDWAEYYLDGTLIYGWQWTLGANGGGSQLQLAACDFFGATATTSFFFDDFMIEDITPPMLNAPSNLAASVMGYDVHLTWDAPAGEALTGYNVYRDGAVIDFTTELMYNDMGLTVGTYEYYVTAVYDEGESDPSNMVSVDVIQPSNCLFEDDFESYNVGDQLVLTNPTDWTTWSNTPGSAEDPFIVDNGGNVVEITGTNDLVHVIPNYTTGFYSITFDMYIPTGYDGYFNTLQDFAGASSQWGMQVYFYSGAGSIDGGAAGAATFTYPYDTWMAMQVDVDLDNDWAEFYLDGVLIHGWVWSSGTFGTGTLNQLGGNNFYAGFDLQDPLYHFDNYCIAGATPLAPPINLEAMVEDNDVMLTWEAPAGGKGMITSTGQTIGTPAIEKSAKANNTPYPPSDAQFDLLFDVPVGVGGGEAGIETDGTYIYTSKWNGAGEFYKYDAAGTYLSVFTIAGSTGCRDIAYDGTYFYGGAASTTIFEMDFDAQTMVSTFTGPAACRAVAYNENDDAFYCNNWSDNITKFDKTGANLGSFPVGASAASYYGLAYDNYSGGEYLWGYSQTGATLNTLIQIELPSGAETGLTFDVGTVAAVGTGIAGGLCIDGMVVPGYWAIIGTSQNVDIWALELVEGGMSDMSYNVYRDGDMIGSTTNLNYDDMDLDNGTYEYYVTAVYPEGESGPSNMVEATVDVQTAIFFDDFEAYNAGEQLACQNPDDWTTWSNLPCDATEDAYISDAFAYSGNNSVNIVTNNDQVKNFETYFTSGIYNVSMMVYVPTGADGYYNVMSDFDVAYEWGFEVYFNIGGDGTVNGGGTGAATFTYPFDTWMMSKLTVDLDNDMAYYYLDGEMIHAWQWTLGAAGGGSQLQLAAVDFFGATATTSFFFDDFLIEEGEAPAPPPAPMNLTGPDEVTTGEDIVLNWDAPATGAILQWDDGINNDAIGLTSGGTFSVASHWEPADLTAYDGMMLEKITFFAGDYPGPTFTMKVWTGAGATEVFSQPIASFVQNDWNEVELTTPVMIDASMDFWFGYETTHAAGEYPAGCDVGPAIQTYGDMILNGGAWASLYVLTGGVIDANWNLIGTASIADGSKATATVIPMVKPSVPANNSGSFAALGFGSGKKYVPSSSKDLLGYNVYRDAAQIAYVTETTYTDNIGTSGTYEYYVTAVWDAGESDPSNTWTVDVITGINENVQNATQVFPNPATDVVNIASDFNINFVTVYNFAGQAVANEKVNGNVYQVNVAEFQPGIYVFQINTAEGMANYRIVVQ